MRSLSSSIVRPSRVLSVVGPPTGAENCRSICGPGFGVLPAAKLVEHLLEALGRQVLVGSRVQICTIGAFTQAPRHSTSTQENLPSADDVERLVIDAALADLRAASRRRAACTASCRRPARAPSCRPAADEHGVEGRDLEHADVRHAEHLGDVLDRRFCGSQPPAAPARATAAGSPPTPAGLPDIWRSASSPRPDSPP